MEKGWELVEGRAVLKPIAKKSAIDAKSAFRKALVAWFEKNQKDYPWRRTQDPYPILISEVMLQQTQIATVLGKGYYERFLQIFPNVEALATATDEALLKAWEGLGYYRRVRMLRETAKAVIERHDGDFPEKLDHLLELPGVGRYTAGALRAFAFGKPSVLVDGNVSRVFSRLMDHDGPIDDGSGIKQMWFWAEELADDRYPRSYHAGLMELGQQICRPGVPDCMSCPVSKFCLTQRPAELPVKKKKVKMTKVIEDAIWLRNNRGEILMHQEAGKRRTGLWKLPLRSAADVIGSSPLIEQKYGITRYQVTLRVHDGAAVDMASHVKEGDEWVREEAIADLAMAAPFRKAVERLLVDF